MGYAFFSLNHLNSVLKYTILGGKEERKNREKDSSLFLFREDFISRLFYLVYHVSQGAAGREFRRSRFIFFKQS